MRQALDEHPHVGDVRGEGMMCAIEFVADKGKRKFFEPAQKVGPQIAAGLLEKGVIGRAMPQGDILASRPHSVLPKKRLMKWFQKQLMLCRPFHFRFS